MKTFLGIVAVALLAFIAFTLQQRESREADARADSARRNAAYLDCKANAPNPDLCMRPQ